MPKPVDQSSPCADITVASIPQTAGLIPPRKNALFFAVVEPGLSGKQSLIIIHKVIGAHEKFMKEKGEPASEFCKSVVKKYTCPYFSPLFSRDASCALPTRVEAPDSCGGSGTFSLGGSGVAIVLGLGH